MHLRRQRASVSNGLLMAVGAVAAVALLVGLLILDPFQPRPQTAVRGPHEPLIVYCDAGLMPPVEQIAEQFENETGVTVHFVSQNSGALQATIRNAARGDLYIAADVAFIEQLRKEDLAKETIPFARCRLVLAVQPGNPKGISSLDDLLRDDVTYGIAVEQAASGEATRRVLSQTPGLWERLSHERRATARKATARDAAQDVREAVTDAGFIWDATARQEGLHILAVPELDAPAGASTIAAGVLSMSRRPNDALRFAHFLAAADKGQPIMREHHFEPVAASPLVIAPPLLDVETRVRRAGGVQRRGERIGWHGQADFFPLAHEGAEGDPTWANRKNRATCLHQDTHTPLPLAAFSGLSDCMETVYANCRRCP